MKRQPTTTHVSIILNLGNEGWVVDVSAIARQDKRNRIVLAESWMMENKEATLDEVIANIPTIMKRIPR